MSTTEVNGSLAKLRWKLLAKNLLKMRDGEGIPIHTNSSQRDDAFKISVRRFDNFGLFNTRQFATRCGDQSNQHLWLQYDIEMEGGAVIPLKLSLYTSVHCEDLLGFNNTGNICIWPSEEVMAYYLMKECHNWLNGESMTVCELGGGMTCFAGLTAAVVLAHRGSSTSPHELLLTDGNTRSCENIQRIILENCDSFKSGGVKVVANEFIWGQMNHIDHKYKESVDLIICCDCFFFVEAQDDLLMTINFLLTPKTGRALCFAPQRKGTFDIFKEKAEKLFDIEVIRNYLSVVSDLNDKLLIDSTESYCEDLHYPIQIILKHKQPPSNI